MCAACESTWKRILELARPEVETYHGEGCGALLRITESLQAHSRERTTSDALLLQAGSHARLCMRAVYAACCDVGASRDVNVGARSASWSSCNGSTAVCAVRSSARATVSSCPMSKPRPSAISHQEYHHARLGRSADLHPHYIINSLRPHTRRAGHELSHGHSSSCS